MRIELGESRLLELVKRQLGSLYYFDAQRDSGPLERAVAGALKRAEHCFAHAPAKYYRRDGEVYFNPFHSGQYCTFLYFVAHAVWVADPADRLLADRLYCVNKALNGLDLYYEVRMPDIFYTDHPVGSVIGRGTFGEYFSFTQNCTVGNNKGIYPRFGRNVAMLSGSKVVGASSVGDNVVISANAYLRDVDIPAGSLVAGSVPDLEVRPIDEAFVRRVRGA